MIEICNCILDSNNVRICFCDSGYNICIEAVSGKIREVIDNDWQRSGGEWRSLESKEESLIKEAQNNGAKNIVSRRELIYEGDSKRPSKIKFETIIDGETKISEIVNCPSKS